MATLLHLSDLHLVATDREPIINDDKVGVIPPSSQQRALNGVRGTMEAVAAAIQAGDLDLDCIVITGDIADKNDAAGYARLPEFLSPLVPDLVPRQRVIVVPGNHDVTKGAPASSHKRYERFLALREHGYVTPFLEGVDIEDGRLTNLEHSPVHCADDGSFIVVALNSANHSQAPAVIDAAVEAGRAELEELSEQHQVVRSLLESWKARGEHDPCWVDRAQLQAAAHALGEATRRYPHALRIVALHHQLFPVTTTAEIKSFETMVNLGEVLAWVAANGIDAVLHGHKHVGHVAEMLSEASTFGLPDSGRRVLTISGPHAHQHQDGASPVARLLQVRAGAPRTSGVMVADLRPTAPGGTATIDYSTYLLDDDVRTGTVRGQTVAEVHRKLLALPASRYRVGTLLTCVIEHGASALAVPATYPDAPVARDEMTAWFDSLIDWWQAPSKSSAADFNHGERLRAFRIPNAGGVGRLDQLQHAADALRHKESTSRAIAVLLDPSTDLVDANGPDFPAFALVQFFISASKLDVVAYFRKQEMPHWWPFNVGELARLQRDLLALLARPGLVPGSITTITPYPVQGGSVPRVAIPSLDRRTDDPRGLLELVLPLYGPVDAAQAEAARALWRSVLADWEPRVEAPADGEPMPIRGLERVEGLIGDVGAVLSSNNLHDDLLRRLYEIRMKSRAWQEESDAGVSPARRRAWVDSWQLMRNAILEAVDGLLVPDAATPPSA